MLQVSSIHQQDDCHSPGKALEGMCSDKIRPPTMISVVFEVLATRNRLSRVTYLN